MDNNDVSAQASAFACKVSDLVTDQPVQVVLMGLLEVMATMFAAGPLSDDLAHKMLQTALDEMRFENRTKPK